MKIDQYDTAAAMAVATRPELVFVEGHGSWLEGGTYCGNPLMAAVGLAVLDAVAQPAFLARVDERATQLERGLARLIERRGLGGQRGRGLLRALDLDVPSANRVVDATRALTPDGLLLNAPRPNLLRFMPALNVKAQEIDQMLAMLDLVLGESL